MGGFVFLLQVLLYVLQFTVFRKRMAAVKKTRASTMVLLGALVIGVLLVFALGFLVVQRETGEPIEELWLIPIAVNVLAGAGYCLLPYLLLKGEDRLKYRMLPGLKPEVLAAIAVGLGALVVLAGIFKPAY
jgi:hypothetical protein